MDVGLAVMPLAPSEMLLMVDAHWTHWTYLTMRPTVPGEGTSANPPLIDVADQLAYFRRHPEATGRSPGIVCLNDSEAAGEHTWTVSLHRQRMLSRLCSVSCWLCAGSEDQAGRSLCVCVCVCVCVRVRVCVCVPSLTALGLSLFAD